MYLIWIGLPCLGMGPRVNVCSCLGWGGIFWLWSVGQFRIRIQFLIVWVGPQPEPALALLVYFIFWQK